LTDGLREDRTQGRVPPTVDPSDLAERIDSICGRATDVNAERALLIEIEDLLALGYIEALRGEARSRRLAERLEEIMATLDAPGAMSEAQAILRERHLVDASVRELRLRLGVLRGHLARLGGRECASQG
jgi:hypothetical protein